jgi:hypothetical protein
MRRVISPTHPRTNLFLWALTAISSCAIGCPPSPLTQPVAPVDASDASPSPCDIADAATQARLIALPDGAALKVPCP